MYPPPLYPAVRVGSGMHVFPPSVLILERPGGGEGERVYLLYTLIRVRLGMGR